MCQCNSSDMDCEFKKICSCNYLKPLSIDKLFEDDSCNSFESTLEKTKKLRNAFFAAKTAVYNFVNDVEHISNNLLSDLSDNEIELDGIRETYLETINNLNTTLYTSLKVTHNSKNLINIDLSKILNDEFKLRPQRSNVLTLRNPNNDMNLITLSNIPGITIQFNRDNKMTKLAISEPDEILSVSRHSTSRRLPDLTTEYIVSPSIFCLDNMIDFSELNLESFQESLSYELDTDPKNDAFQNLDLARDFFDEIINYQDNYIIDNDTCHNQILEVMNYFDKVIFKYENIHKYIVQLCKIYNN